MWHRLEEQGAEGAMPLDHPDDPDSSFEPNDELEKMDDSLELDDSDDDDATDFQIVQECTFRTCWHYKYCYVCVYIILVIVLIGALIAMVVVVLLVVMPFSRAASFRSAICLVNGSSKHMAESTCSCGKGCDSRYPCMLIVVQYTGERERLYNASIHENEVLLDKKCSFYPPCKTSRTENIETVKKYEKMYGAIGSTYNCLYNPDNHAEVIRTRRFQLHHVIHGMVWSSIILLAAFVLLFLAIKRSASMSKDP